MKKIFAACLLAGLMLLIIDFSSEMQVLGYGEGRTWKEKYEAVKGAYSLKARYRRIVAANNFAATYRMPKSKGDWLVALAKSDTKHIYKVAPGYDKIDEIYAILIIKHGGNQ